ncbi:unnamed protein product [Pleuronectes platessa]|uniref:Uncharacterized protein n=1 Tax=Pleuronectes platessa TaxID=8262 RepID=A0A9N7VVT6_PLEPL|nr:unnamed protein product [Pleuronectes platessa]
MRTCCEAIRDGKTLHCHDWLCARFSVNHGTFGEHVYADTAKALRVPDHRYKELSPPLSQKSGLEASAFVAPKALTFLLLSRSPHSEGSLSPSFADSAHPWFKLMDVSQSVVYPCAKRSLTRPHLYVSSTRSTELYSY